MNFDEIMKKCCICSEEYVCLDDVIKFPCDCKYIHHKDCLLEWLGYPGSGCPICRKSYLGGVLLKGVYTTDVELPDFEPFYFHQPITIDYQSMDSDDNSISSNDTDSLIGVDYTGNPLGPIGPVLGPLVLLDPPYQLQTQTHVEHQFTPDAPLNPLADPDFSLTIDHSFSIPLYINQSSVQDTTTNSSVPPIITQLFNQNFGLNLNQHI